MLKKIFKFIFLIFFKLSANEQLQKHVCYVILNNNGSHNIHTKFRQFLRHKIQIHIYYLCLIKHK